MTDVFALAFASTVGEEGGFTADPNDKGNWTGGARGVGLCRGTKFGISAASYPALDIAGLTLDDARAIYRRDYWAAIRADDLPVPLALAAFDMAVNSNVPAAARTLQRALGVVADGMIGPATIAAARAALGDPASPRVVEVLDDFHARRLLYMAEASGWSTYGLGWARRVLRVHRRVIASAAKAAA